MEPSELPNLRLWVRADQIEGLSDGDLVSTWSDLSGAANHLTSSGESRPTYKANQIKGKPAIRFANKVIKNTAFSKTTMTGFVAFIIYTVQANAGGFGRILAMNPEGGNDFSEGLSLDLGSSGRTEDDYLNATGAKTPNENVDLKTSKDAFGTYSLVTLNFNTPTIQAWIDLVAQGTRAGSATAVGCKQVRLGKGFFGGAEQDAATVDIAEVAIVEATLTAEQREGIEAYLYGKYFGRPQIFIPGRQSRGLVLR